MATEQLSTAMGALVDEETGKEVDAG